MDRQPAAVLAVGKVVELLEYLRVHHAYKVVEAGIIVRMQQ